MQAALSFVSLVAIAVLGAITFLLSMKRHVGFFVTVGQDMFKWMTLVLGAILVTRAGIAFHLISTNSSRSANSVIFVLCVFGIVWSVLRHGRK